MIDLRKRSLQSTIEHNGISYGINTDYRLWLDLPEKLQRLNERDYDGYISLFADDIPPISNETVEALIAFYNPPRVLPNTEYESGHRAEVIDYIIDADYIYAGFMQAYGIDLVDAEMHWHKFLALVEGLPEGTVMTNIIQYRSYDGNSSDVGYKEYCRLQNMWKLPEKMSEEDEQKVAEFEAYFGG